MNRTLKVKPRIWQNAQKTPVFRVPREISDTVYEAFNTLAHRARLAEGTAVFANRMIREESFNREELLAIKAIINGDEEAAGLSGEILGSGATLEWIEAVLAGRIQANA
jgi:hypothetical protein